MKRTALIVLTHGVEDIEAVSPIDVLNRAGVLVTAASLEPGPVAAANGTKIIADTTLSEISDLYDAIICPGGLRNAEDLAANPKVIELVRAHYDAGKLVAAICAAPGLVLAQAAGVLRGRRATGDPGFDDKLAAGGAIVTEENVTCDGNIITGRGPGAALEFSLKIAEYMAGRATAEDFAKRWRVVM